MTSEDSPEYLRLELTKLAYRKQLAFILLAISRMLLGLEQFSAETGFDIRYYLNLVDGAWKCLAADMISSKLSHMALGAVQVPPDTENFDSRFVSDALNAALAVDLLKEFLSSPCVDHALEISLLARDTVTLHAQRSATVFPYSLTYEEVIRHPLVYQEMKRQCEDVSFLAQLPEEPSRTLAKVVEERAKAKLASATAGSAT